MAVLTSLCLNCRILRYQPTSGDPSYRLSTGPNFLYNIVDLLVFLIFMLKSKKLTFFKVKFLLIEEIKCFDKLSILLVLRKRQENGKKSHNVLYSRREVLLF